MKPIRARLNLLFTPELCRADPWQTLAAAIRGGVDLVQWRVKPPQPGADVERARAICRDTGVGFIVNDDPSLAAAVDADGVHVGQDDGPFDVARDVIGPDRWLGISTHDERQIAAARTAGADYLGFGPMFATATKGYAAGLAADALARARRAAGGLPVFAIGGITLANVAEVRARGAERIAISSVILTAEDPERVATELGLALDPG